MYTNIYARILTTPISYPGTYEYMPHMMYTIYMYMYMYIYEYIYKERERKRSCSSTEGTYAVPYIAKYQKILANIAYILTESTNIY